MDATPCEHDFFRPFARTSPKLWECAKCQVRATKAGDPPRRDYNPNQQVTETPSNQDSLAPAEMGAARARSHEKVAPLVPHQWKKGQSGNPKGMTKGVSQMARDATRDGLDVVTFMRRMMDGKIKGARPSDRADAAKWLVDRGHGKTPDLVVTTDLGKNDALSYMSVEQLQMLAKARTVPALPENSGPSSVLETPSEAVEVSAVPQENEPSASD